MSVRSALAAALATVALGLAGGALAAPPDDGILPLDQYTTDKGRRLATTHGEALRALTAEIYHCMPWVEVQKRSIGFFKPKHLAQDDRYLSVRIYIEQDPSPQFAKLAIEDRASAMFSRYVGPLLRRMARSGALLADGDVDGFTVILEWLKQAPQAAGARPIHETIAVFLPKDVVASYLAGSLATRDLGARARVLGWDGEAALGALRVSAWDDNFVATYTIKNYELEPGVSCH